MELLSCYLVYYKQGGSLCSLHAAPGLAIFHHNNYCVHTCIHCCNAKQAVALQTQHGEVSVVKETM